jgi:hypothetical protein
VSSRHYLGGSVNQKAWSRLTWGGGERGDEMPCSVGEQNFDHSENICRRADLFLNRQSSFIVFSLIYHYCQCPGRYRSTDVSKPESTRQNSSPHPREVRERGESRLDRTLEEELPAACASDRATGRFCQLCHGLLSLFAPLSAPLMIARTFSIVIFSNDKFT